MNRLGLFGYGSLVLPESASMTLGRPAGEMQPVQLHDWRRRFSQRRDNLTCEKTFECDGGWRPEWVLGLNVEEGEDPAGPVNGVVIELSEAELDRLDIREIRYDRVDVTGSIEGDDLPERIVTYTAKPFHFAPEAPDDAVILETYASAVELGFSTLGNGELEHYRVTTPYPVERMDATLVVDRIPEGNPRAW
jgi:Gamma-glutamyl cyclotransferase, AIG2-like